MKLRNTRKQRAAELLKRLTYGPAFSDPVDFGGKPFSVDEATRQFRNWSQSWVIAELKHLVPELKSEVLRCLRCSRQSNEADCNNLQCPYCGGNMKEIK
jgi:hypothetical protein